MNIRLKVTTFWLILIVLISCVKPAIPISNSLKTGLGDRYSDYVKLINKSASGDGKALVLLLQYQNIDDGAGYDHGWVLIELMKNVGDKQFSDALFNLSPSQVDHVKNYFNAGFDVHNKTDKLSNEYPKTFKVLGYSNTGGVPFK